MAVENFDTLAWKIVRALQDREGVTVAELDRHLVTEFGIDCSLATVYRRVAELRAAHVIVQQQFRLYLNRVWLEQMIALLAQFELFARSAESVPCRVPTREGERIEYRASSLMELDPVWNTVLLKVGSLATEGELFGYNAHAWYPAALLESEQALYRALSRRGVRTHLLFGGGTVVDEWGTSRLQAPTLAVFHARKRLSHENIACWASKNYFMQCFIPLSLLRELRAILAKIRNPESEGAEPIRALFESKAPCRLVVWKSAPRAQAFRASVQNEFLN